MAHRRRGRVVSRSRRVGAVVLGMRGTRKRRCSRGLSRPAERQVRHLTCSNRRRYDVHSIRAAGIAGISSSTLSKRKNVRAYAQREREREN